MWIFPCPINNANNTSPIQTNTAYRQGSDNITILSCNQIILAKILRRSKRFYSYPCIDMDSFTNCHAQKSIAKPYKS